MQVITLAGISVNIRRPHHLFRFVFSLTIMIIMYSHRIGERFHAFRDKIYGKAHIFHKVGLIIKVYGGMFHPVNVSA